MESKYILDNMMIGKFKELKTENGLKRRKAIIIVEMLSIGNVSEITEEDVMTNAWNALEKWEWKKVKK